jgi:hypothetical protein
MGYDLEPLRTLESKRAFLAEAVREGWRIVFGHDPRTAIGTPAMEGKDLVLRDVVAAPGVGATPGAAPGAPPGVTKGVTLSAAKGP